MQSWTAAAVLTLCGAACGQVTPEGANRVALEAVGTITRIELAQNDGTPFIEIKLESGQSVRVRLGSMQYLMEQNFNPKMGHSLKVKGFRSGGEVVAVSVEIPAEKRIVRFRDAGGRPLWIAARNRQKGT